MHSHSLLRIKIHEKKCLGYLYSLVFSCNLSVVGGRSPNRKAIMATRKKKSKTFTKGEVLAIVKAAAEANAKAGIKAFYTDNGAVLLADAIAHAFTIPTLASAGIGNSKSAIEAQARRDFCKKHKARAVTPDKVLRKNTSGRAENALDQRLQSVALQMGLNAKAFYAVRSKSVTGTDESPRVFIVLR